MFVCLALGNVCALHKGRISSEKQPYCLGDSDEQI